MDRYEVRVGGEVLGRSWSMHGARKKALGFLLSLPADSEFVGMDVEVWRGVELVATFIGESGLDDDGDPLLPPAERI